MQHIVSNTIHNQEADVTSWPILDFETTRVYMCCTQIYLQIVVEIHSTSWWKYKIHPLFVSRRPKYAGAQYLERRGERRDGKLIDRTIKEKLEICEYFNFYQKKIFRDFCVCNAGIIVGFLFSSIPDTDLDLIAAMPQCTTQIQHITNTVHCKYE